MHPLRIRFFVNLVHQQGTYFRFHNLALALSRLGQTVEILGLDHDTKSRAQLEIRDGIAYRIIPSARGLSRISAFVHPANPMKMYLGSSRTSCDVAHLFQPFPAAACAWHQSSAVVKFYDWDDLWVGGLMSGPLSSFRMLVERTATDYFESRLPAIADHVTTCGNFLADMARMRGARQVSALPNGLWPFQPAVKSHARSKLGLEQDAFYVGFMGRTCAELDWCFAALRHAAASNLRLAICGAPADILNGLDTETRQRVDFLGQLTPVQTRDFAAALNLGLLPLADSAFNRSRFPIKFAEYMAAGTPLLCSEVGECGRLATEFPWVLKAGNNKEAWIQAFVFAVDALMAGRLPAVDMGAIKTVFSWEKIGSQLLSLYRSQITQKSTNLLV